jgi:DNA polymerase I-like protein with 3'-5' exonuclease and polymerase domains
LVETAIRLLPIGARFADLCTGSGCIAVSTLAERPDTNAIALEKFPATLALAERNAINAPIQGTSADIIKLAMTNVARRIKDEGLQSRMILQIHDELVFDAVVTEVDTLKNIVTEEMENVIKLSVPLTVECNHGKNWLEAH